MIAVSVGESLTVTALKNHKTGDMKYWDNPNLGGDLWQREGAKEESYEDKAKRILRESGMNPDFEGSSNPSENVR